MFGFYFQFFLDTISARVLSEVEISSENRGGITDERRSVQVRLCPRAPEEAGAPVTALIAVAVICTSGGVLLGIMILSWGAAANSHDIQGENLRLAKALQEAAMHLRMAGLNTAADLAMQALDKPKERSTC